MPLKLFFALLLIDILVTWIQFIAEGQLDAPHFLGRLLKQVLSGGFVYLMIVNAFSWMNAVLKSFSAIGASVTGLPALNPQSVIVIGANMAETIFNSPGNCQHHDRIWSSRSSRAWQRSLFSSRS